ncbi:MAG: cytochrome c biogenesis protein CcdA [Candidatus Andersenbacteria bacterium]|nr:cytochrome c biogenesis protein CcdA [bacterium]MDZ4225482.1 cytochrome c biogenesis protein CcdA [Candidatus Andersenbacteria bacterium]
MEALYQVSLVAAFVAGMVALFAPCCITFLLPAYLGNVFKEKKKVLLMTLVYSLGIFVVMLPIVLGARALAGFFFRWHDVTYYVGGVFMIMVAGLALLGVKLPMWHPRTGKLFNRADIPSTFVLGLISGVTSACCAPVLVGVLTLSSLSPTMLQALGVGAVYVLGMVAPLYAAALLVRRGNILNQPWMLRQIKTLRLGGREYSISVTNIIAAAIFLFMGALTLILTAAGKLSMPSTDSPTMRAINSTAVQVTRFTDSVPLINFFGAVVLIYLVYWVVRKTFREE